MKKLLATLVAVLLVVPFLLSFVAEYYLKHQLKDQFASNTHIENFSFSRGWFESTAQLDLVIEPYGLIIDTTNSIKQGPVVWKKLLGQPFDSFAWYQIDTEFDLLSQTNKLAEDTNRGSANTRVNFLGQTIPVINHPGLELSLLGMQWFTDLNTIEGQISPDGHINARYAGNQLEFNNRYQNIYLTNPDVRIMLSPELPLPATIQATVNQFSGLFGSQTLLIDRLNFTNEFNFENQTYSLLSAAKSETINVNQAALTQTQANIKLENISPNIVEHLAVHHEEIINAIENSQLLVLLKHVADLIKLIELDQPTLKAQFTGQFNDQEVVFDFSGELLAHDSTQLNPFALLESLTMNLKTVLPSALVSQINHAGFSRFIQYMLNKNILIEKQGSYYAKLYFQDSKLKLANSTP